MTYRDAVHKINSLLRFGMMPGLERIQTLLDRRPVLTPEGIQLALWMRERYFCTVYDAVKAMLPGKLQESIHTIIQNACKCLFFILWILIMIHQKRHILQDGAFFSFCFQVPVYDQI